MNKIITIMASMTMLSATYLFSANAAEKTQLTNRLSFMESGVSSKVAENLKNYTNKNLQLQVNIPGNLQIPDQLIRWSIKSKAQQTFKELSGRQQGLDLPTGWYDIRLSIGQFVTEKRVEIHHDQQVRPKFDVELASLHLSSNQVVDWVLIGSDKRKFVIKQKSQLNQLLPADNYTVHAVLRDMPLQQQIKLDAGEKVVREVNIPVGQVKLVAIKDNQPLFKPVSWKVYRLSKLQRKEVGRYRFHSQLISIPVGHYEAVAEYEGKLHKRRFLMQPGMVNSVVLAMD